MSWFSLFLFLASLSWGASPIDQIQFKANSYQRDNIRNLIKAKGSAWVKKGNRQVWADNLEIDVQQNKVYAVGNVHIQEGDLNIFCQEGVYGLEEAEGTLEEVTLLFGQTVISGQTLIQKNKEQFELINGFYTNCNTLPITGKSASRCPFDVKIYGRRFDLTLDSYVHIFDGIIYAQELPVFYTPYFIAPAKTRRQTGFLSPSNLFRQRIGTGFSFPFFWALSSWQDLTITPTWWTEIGTHLELDYRYIYSRKAHGRARLFLLENKFNPDRNTPWIRVPGEKALGLVSELGLDLHNEIEFNHRLYSRQDLDFVTNNYWAQDFPTDFGALANFEYLRNQVSLSWPSDSSLLTGAVKYHPSLINTLTSQFDKGSVSQTPELRFHRKTLPFLTEPFYFEWDNRFTNFYRPVFSQDASETLRTGQRLSIQRRLLLNAPLAPGFQFQPLFQGGLTAYHFSEPQSVFKSQTFMDAQIPFALYLTRTYGDTSIQEGAIRHIVQPRVLYEASLFRSKTPDQIFFDSVNSIGFSNPRFDQNDFSEPYEYFRFELNNRLLKKTDNSGQRFLLAQISNNYFLKPSLINRQEVGLGPLEIYLDLQLGSFSSQFQGLYHLKKVDGVNESDWSATVAYSASSGDKVSVATLLRNRAEKSDNDETVVLTVYKTLPIYLDVFGSIEHSFRQSFTRNYQVGFLFAAKPRNCWSLSFLTGRTVQLEQYARLVFGLTFGGA